jgi:DMSO/TMAO reductase YedYZ heme-binding membrane subunit
MLLIAGVLGIAGQTLGPNPIREMLHMTGKTSLNLLMITLMVSPLRETTDGSRYSGYAECSDYFRSRTP